MDIYSKLAAVQQQLKVEKNQWNGFGKYKYRNIEDINEALKPILKEQKCSLKYSDEIKLIGDRFYIEATVKLIDLESGSTIESKGWAREDLELKGMSGGQITGATSSYARKYAVQGLMLIDNNPDLDAIEEDPQPKNPIIEGSEEPNERQASVEKIDLINKFVAGKSEAYGQKFITRLKEKYGKTKVEELTADEANQILLSLYGQEQSKPKELI